MNTTITPIPFESLGRRLVGLLLVFLALIWFSGLYAYSTLPENIPTHFGMSGKPDSFGSRFVFLVLPVAFSIAPILILLVVRFRFTLINSYPYLVSLPAFFTNLANLSDDRRGYWVNRYFELVAAIGVFVSILLLALLLGIYAGTVAGSIPWWFTIVVVALPLVLIVSLVIALRNMSVELKDEIG